MRTKELTGRKVLLIAVAAFGVILAANLTMLFAATGTFPGLVVKNSYVASQEWNLRASEQRALGWKAQAAISGEGLAVRMVDAEGHPVLGLTVSVVIGRPASQAEDRRLELVEDAGIYRADVDLAEGLWRVEIHGSDAEGRSFKAEAELFAKAAS
ncbi:FixH family protein [Limibaculum sp. M0105]|uniref:FixH family protein n=1 Tax=Thermohalobaculum xanthum TaxID=2753746 RepID=A0A8J7SHV4_9RHOB|nr:FixH family protein [Thermohalobaculum xanthum]MBK0400992.1 FixH family protein [Thermohalobaculum xanthum]